MEILASKGIVNAFHELGVVGTDTFQKTDGEGIGKFKVYEINTATYHTLLDASSCCWAPNWGWFVTERMTVPVRLGTPYEVFTINGQMMIGWSKNTNKNSYDTFDDYLEDEMGITDNDMKKSVLFTLARFNGMSLSKFMNTFV